MTELDTSKLFGMLLNRDNLKRCRDEAAAECEAAIVRKARSQADYVANEVAIQEEIIRLAQVKGGGLTPVRGLHADAPTMTVDLTATQRPSGQGMISVQAENPFSWQGAITSSLNLPPHPEGIEGLKRSIAAQQATSKEPTNA